MSTRKQYYLAKLSEQYNDTLPKPVARVDYYLAKMCGIYDGTLPQALTREERYLEHIAKNGNSGSGGATPTQRNPIIMPPAIVGKFKWTSV